jgi:hypothetical protein
MRYSHLLQLCNVRLEEDEMKKLVEQHKREKLEEKMARQRVKDQIEQDKLARRAKFGISSPTDGMQQPPTTAAADQTLQQPSVATQPSKDYAQTRLQVPHACNVLCIESTDFLAYFPTMKGGSLESSGMYCHVVK